jgi:hypothetical protein
METLGVSSVETMTHSELHDGQCDAAVMGGYGCVDDGLWKVAVWGEAAGVGWETKEVISS